MTIRFSQTDFIKALIIGIMKSNKFLSFTYPKLEKEEKVNLYL